MIQSLYDTDQTHIGRILKDPQTITPMSALLLINSAQYSCELLGKPNDVGESLKIVPMCADLEP